MSRNKRTLDADTDLLLTELQEEQSRLSAELEKAFLAYDRKTRTLAKRLAKWADGDAEPVELERLREEQEDLWRVVRRTQAAVRSTRDLETELREWADRSDTSMHPAHPDHPAARTEIVSSELRLRGRDPDALVRMSSSEPFEGSARDVDPVSDVLEAAMNEPEEEAPLEEEVIPVIVGAPWDTEAVEHLIREIEDCGREIRRANAHEDRDQFAGEIVIMLKDMRRLHAELRSRDRAAGIRRYRIGIGRESFI